MVKSFAPSAVTASHALPADGFSTAAMIAPDYCANRRGGRAEGERFASGRFNLTTIGSAPVCFTRCGLDDGEGVERA